VVGESGLVVEQLLVVVRHPDDLSTNIFWISKHKRRHKISHSTFLVQQP
jgi:hypothetical protein